jgi:hypothetical protein
MQPRIVFNTHYQIHEPAYMKFLILLCTSPVQSNYREVVAEKLGREITTRGKKLNAAAGGYAVDLAKDLGLITPNNTWTEKGHLVNLITIIRGGDLENEFELTIPEKLLYFRVFFEGDGAAFLFIARRLLKYGSVADSDTDWNIWAKEMFVEVYSEYLSITNSTSDRVALRRVIDRLNARGYDGNTGSHKILLHLQTLYRLGLVIRPEAMGARATQLPKYSDGERIGISVLLDRVPNVVALEKVVNAQSWIEVAADVLQLTSNPYPVEETRIGNTLSLLIPYYRRVMSTGISLCPLSTLIESIQIELLSKRALLLTHSIASNLILASQKERPKEIRFHVNRRGQPAFVKLSDDIVKMFS